jgi:hypothetical protein
MLGMRSGGIASAALLASTPLLEPHPARRRRIGQLFFMAAT